MKNFIRIALIGLVFFTSQSFIDACECGSHEKGITIYYVGKEQGCCSGKAQGEATTTYFELSEGVWKAVGQKELSPGDAQSSCCDVFA